MRRLAGVLVLCSCLWLFVGAFCLPSPLAAQGRPLVWQRMVMPTGGRVNTLAINPANPSLLLAGTDTGVYLSRDGGERWTESVRGLPPQREILTLSINPGNPNLILAGGTHGLFRSGDGGQSWERAGGELANELITSIAFVPSDTRTVFISTLNALYQSSDGGQHWKAVTIPTPAEIGFWSVAIDAAQPQIIYAGGDGGALYRSSDGGATWRVANQGLPKDARIQALIINPQLGSVLFAATSVGLFRTTNSGANWVQVGGAQCAGPVRAIDIDRLNTSFIYAGIGEGGLCRSQDNGEAWSLLGSMPSNVPIFSLAIDPKIPVRIFLATGNGIYATRDGGGRWVQLNNGLGMTVLWLAALGGKPPVALAGTRWNLLRTMGNSSAWEVISGSFDNTYVLSLAIDPRNRQRVFAGTWNGEIYQSLDSGAHWQRISSVLAGGGEITALTADDATLYAAVAEVGVFVSRDGGVNWSPLSEGLEQAQVSELHLTRGTPPSLVAATARGLYRLNAAERWERVNTLPAVEISAIAIDPQNPNLIYASADNGLFKSSDGGENFKLLSSATLPTNLHTSALLVNPRRSNVIYAGTAGGLFRSSDYGQSWQAANEGLPPQTQVDFIAISPDEPTILYAATSNHGIYRGEDPELVTSAPPETINIPVDGLVYATGLLAIAVLSTSAFAVARRQRRLSAAQSIEERWPEIRLQIEKALLDKGEVERDELTTLAPDLRFRALQRYVDEHPTRALTLSLDPPLIKLSDSLGIQKFFRNWHIALRGVDTGGELDPALGRITTQLCNMLGFILLDQRRYKSFYGYVVQAPALRLRIPPRFPIIYLPPSAIHGNIASELQDMLGVLNMTSYFALLVVLSDAPDAESKQALLKARTESIPDFIIMDGQGLASMLMARDPERALVSLILDQVELTVVSPYVIAGPVAENMFFGRERELKTITRTARDRNFAVVGGRKIGKTSVLGKVYRLLAGMAGFHPLYLDCQAVQDHAGFIDTINTMWDVELSGSAPDAMRRYLHDLKEEQGDRVVVLLLDEVDLLLQYDMLHRESLFRTLRAAAQEGYCRFVFCGEKTLDAALHNPASALFNFCDIVHVGFIEPRDARRLIQEPLSEMGIEIEHVNELVSEIIGLSACHPNIIQYICQQLIAAINQRRARRITLRDFETVSQSSALHDYFIEVTWGNTSALERLLTLCIIEAGGSLKEADLPAAAYKQGVRVSRRDMRRALDNLELYSIVHKEGDSYRLINYAFPSIIRQTQDLRSLVRSLVSNVYRNDWEEERMPQ